MTLGRRLPEGAWFAQVGDLFELPQDEIDRMMIWTGGNGSARWASGWMNLASLVRRPYPSHESHLSMCPSGMVVVVAYSDATS